MVPRGDVHIDGHAGLHKMNVRQAKPVQLLCQIDAGLIWAVVIGVAVLVVWGQLAAIPLMVTLAIACSWQEHRSSASCFCAFH